MCVNLYEVLWLVPRSHKEPIRIRDYCANQEFNQNKITFQNIWLVRSKKIYDINMVRSGSCLLFCLSPILLPSFRHLLCDAFSQQYISTFSLAIYPSSHILSLLLSLLIYLNNNNVQKSFHTCLTDSMLDLQTNIEISSLSLIKMRENIPPNVGQCELIKKKKPKLKIIEFARKFKRDMCVCWRKVFFFFFITGQKAQTW